MSERKVDTEIVWKQCTNDSSLIDEGEIIDVSAYDFDDTDGWLYVPKEHKTEFTVHDLNTWLKSEPELSFSANRKFVDTRTFTRSKKRSSRTSFESILESLSSPVSNTWRTSNFSNIEEDLSKYADIPTTNREETVPSMLKMASNGKSSFSADETTSSSGQESMEVFLNMSQSKGIDSFINLMEPGIGDPLMNVSQPSIFYSSITSLPRDDCSQNVECDKDEESVNLSDLCNQKVGKLEVTKTLNMNETFSKLQEQDNNESYCLGATDRTFTNKSGSDKKDLNKTYDDYAASAMAALSNLDIDKSRSTLSSTFVNNYDNSTRTEQKKEWCNLNETFASDPQKEENSFVLDSTYSAGNTETVSNNATRTFKYNIQRDKGQLFDVQKNAVHDVTKIIDGSPTATANFPFSPIHDGHLNSTFKMPMSLCNQSTPINCTLKTTNKTLDTTRVYNTAVNSNVKGPTSLRKELLAEIFRSGDHKLNCTFDQIAKDRQNGISKNQTTNAAPDQNAKSDIPMEYKYNTYRKDSSFNKMKVHGVVNEAGVCPENPSDKKYYTFTRKGNNAHGGKTDMENADTVDNMDSTFVKPLPKLQRQKQHIPKMLSKLPQFLQKSNPNLVSNSMRAVNMTGGRHAAGFGYMKGSQPNIVRDVDKSLGNKLYSFGKLKSGSEQRLLELNSGMGDLQMLGAAGSTESIESTQSAHSAPDLDDRLSTCSDSSHNSYVTQPMNIEQLHQIVRMQEESLKQDTVPRLNRRVLENTWTELKKNLPSPILKNGVDDIENDSPGTTEFTVKTSSPILSPTRSSQTINIDIGHSTESPLKQQNEADVVQKDETFTKPLTKIDNKTTRLRQPTNWNAGNRPANQMSAIPRPPSRIPGPRLVRPAVKNIQGDIRRGYM